MKINYSKGNPSKSYLKNIDYYKTMHETGYKKIDGTKREPENAYDGKSTIPFAKIIKKIIVENKCNSLLDYGCGKGKYYFEKFDFEDDFVKNLMKHQEITHSSEIKKWFKKDFEEFCKDRFPDEHVILQDNSVRVRANTIMGRLMEFEIFTKDPQSKSGPYTRNE